ncbi:MAG: ArsI/CadI family heavy metal resistance metalloenzyme [Rhodospirillaceae bacterium]|jgi:catechol 2,3-dioxygenase-like lactoylglutathione lyase family enzyme
MKRLHIHVKVTDLKQAMDFYSSLFSMEPSVVRDDYAKWMVEDPRVNFAVSSNSESTGVDHLGIQVENEEELKEVYNRLDKAGRPVLEEGRTTCCYAEQNKSWISDPDNVPWEAFLTHGVTTVYGKGANLEKLKTTKDSGDKPLTACCP